MKTDLIHRFAGTLANQEDSIPYVVWIRSVYASIETVSLNVPYDVVNYATDLGVRIRTDPYLLISETVKSMHSNQLSSLLKELSSVSSQEWFDDWERNSCSSKDFTLLLYLLINYLGEWETASNIAELYLQNNYNKSDLSLNLYISSAVNFKNEAISDIVYRGFESDKSLSPIDRVMVLIRHAAFLIKRLKRLGDADTILNEARNLVLSSCKESIISYGDSQVLMAVIDNLDALHFLSLNDRDSAYRMIRDAYSLIKQSEALAVVGLDEAKRYYEQIKINVIQMLVETDDLNNAYDLSLELADWVKNYHPYYYGEALYIQGYLEYLLKMYKKSVCSLNMSAGLYIEEGSVTALNSVRSLLAVVNSKLGDNITSKYCICSIHNDPAGLCDWRESTYGKDAARILSSCRIDSISSLGLRS